MANPKWNRWKLIHKETGYTFKRYVSEGNRVINDSGSEEIKTNDMQFIPVLLESGIPAVYVKQGYYPYMFFLRNSDWIVEMRSGKNV